MTAMMGDINHNGDDDSGFDEGNDGEFQRRW
jgi:hypothetical protein